MCVSGERAHRKLPPLGANDNSRNRASQPGRGYRGHFGAREEGTAKHYFVNTVVFQVLLPLEVLLHFLEFSSGRVVVRLLPRRRILLFLSLCNDVTMKPSPLRWAVMLCRHAMPSCWAVMPCHHSVSCCAVMLCHALPSCYAVVLGRHAVPPCSAVILCRHAGPSCCDMPCTVGNR